MGQCTQRSLVHGVYALLDLLELAVDVASELEQSRVELGTQLGTQAPLEQR